MHVAQSHETRAEMKELMMVPKNIISPQVGGRGGGGEGCILACRGGGGGCGCYACFQRFWSGYGAPKNIIYPQPALSWYPPGNCRINNITSPAPQANKPVIYIVQDTLLGSR